jgi:hypothetical protein
MRCSVAHNSPELQSGFELPYRHCRVTAEDHGDTSDTNLKENTGSKENYRNCSRRSLVLVTGLNKDIIRKV